MDKLFEEALETTELKKDYEYVILFMYVFIRDELKNKVIKSVIILEK